MIEIRRIPKPEGPYPCFERHPAGVAVWSSWTAAPRWLTPEQFNKEFPMNDPSMKAAPAKTGLFAEQDERAAWAKAIADKHPYLNVGKCSSCGAAILWGKTPDGKNMPLDPAARPLAVLVLDGPNRAVRTERALGSHWATCPLAHTHRKPT